MGGTKYCSNAVIEEATTMKTHAPISLPFYPRDSPLVYNVDILRLVISFIGPKHYRFIAVISQSFHMAYKQEFPNDTETNVNASTVAYAKICWEDFTHHMQCQLARSAASFGNLAAMKYLHSVGCYLSANTCTKAARNGHLNVLQYIRENGCPWDLYTCAYTAESGHLHILQ